MNVLRTSWMLILGMMVHAVGASLAASQEKGAREDAAAGRDEAAVQPARPEMVPLELLVGPWRFVETHFDSAGRELSTAEGTEEITWVLDRQAIRRAYTRRGDYGVFSAIGHLAYSEVKKQYLGLWLNNDPETGPIFVSGDWQPQTESLVVNFESHRRDGTVQRFRVVERFIDPEQREATTFELRNGAVIKRLVVRYKRAVPCPDRIRVIFDDAIGARRSP